jgi:uncharacterized phage protein (TIGR02218 family)
MTSYDANMKATEMVAMPEFYRFSRGYDNWYYTNAKTSLVFNNSPYVPSAIERGPFTIQTDLAVVSVTLTSQVLDQFADVIANAPSQRIRCRIYRAISDTLTNFGLLFDGNIISIAFNEKNIASATVVQKAGILDRNVQMIYHSVSCNHHVFQGDCNLDVIDWQVKTNVSVSGSDLVSSAFDAYDDGYFKAGMVECLNDYRMITNHVGDTITLHVPFDDRLSTGDEVTVLPGCDGLASTCLEKFDNLDNYLGCPYIPSKNPAIWGV